MIRTKMRADRIKVLEKDLPQLTGVPPNRKDNEAFDQLCVTVKREGLLTPVFVDENGVCVQGHYRLWAALFAELRHVPVVIVRKPGDVGAYFEEVRK